MKVGIAFAQDNRNMQYGKWQYESDKPKLTVDPTQNPQHLQVFNRDGGTQFSVGAGGTAQETLLAIPHHMPFSPMFLCYFYTSDAPALFAANIGQYTLNYALMRYNAVPWSEELYAKVDATNFYIIHHVDNTAGGSPITSYGSQYKFRVRMEIIARPAVNLGGPSF